jgi:hypothetical protein
MSTIELYGHDCAEFFGLLADGGNGRPPEDVVFGGDVVGWHGLVEGHFYAGDRADEEWAFPFVNFGVAIRERKAASASVIAAGKIDDANITITEAFGHFDCHGCVVDAVGVFLTEDPCFYWQPDIGELAVDAPGRAGQPPAGVENLTHGITSDARQFLILVKKPPRIGWAFPDLCILADVIEEGAGSHINVGVDLIRNRIGIEVPFDPKDPPLSSGGCIRQTGEEQIAIIDGVHIPAVPHLPIVVHATHSHGFCFGPGERGQQHRGEDGDDGDDDEQFDKGESVSSRALLVHSIVIQSAKFKSPRTPRAVQTGRNPFRLVAVRRFNPRVASVRAGLANARQPWALRRNPFGIPG